MNPRLPDEVIGLFPIPLMRSRAVLDTALVDALAAHFSSQTTRDNNSCANLSHTRMLRPEESPLLGDAARLVLPRVAEFGTHLFGEALAWGLKEMWVNVLDPGGRQAMHNHANSFVSGIVYLTPTHPDSQTVFMRSPGGTDFTFKNDHAGSRQGPYNADKWVSPAPSPGDVLLFPSYLLHAVPPNPGPRRITLAFNAIPSRLDSWGYVVGFSG